MSDDLTPLNADAPKVPRVRGHGDLAIPGGSSLSRMRRRALTAQACGECGETVAVTGRAELENRGQRGTASLVYRCPNGHPHRIAGNDFKRMLQVGALGDGVEALGSVRDAIRRAERIALKAERRGAWQDAVAALSAGLRAADLILTVGGAKVTRVEVETHDADPATDAEIEARAREIAEREWKRLAGVVDAEVVK